MRLVKMILKGASSRKRTKRSLTDWAPLLTLIFNITLEKTVREGHLNRQKKILNKSHQFIGYANDVARKLKEPEETINRMVDAAN